MPDATAINSAWDRRWLILGVIGLAQLMVVLDLTVMNIALPSAQRALHFTTVDRQSRATAKAGRNRHIHGCPWKIVSAVPRSRESP